MTLVLGSVAMAAESAPKKDIFVDPAAGEGFCLHSLFQSNLVLQRGKPIAVWGWSTPGDKITVTFAGKTGTSTAGKDHSWKVTLPAMEASSKPATMTIEHRGGKVTLENILIGDIWVLGGQSNMERTLSHVEDGDLEIAGANFPNIRAIKIPKIYGPEPKKNFPNAEEYSRISGGKTSTRATGRSARRRPPGSFPPSATSWPVAFTWLRRSRSAS